MKSTQDSSAHAFFFPLGTLLPSARAAARALSRPPASEVLSLFDPVPQLLKNVRFNGGAAPLDSDEVRKRISAAEAELEGRGLTSAIVGEVSEQPGVKVTR